MNCWGVEILFFWMGSSTPVASMCFPPLLHNRSWNTVVLYSASGTRLAVLLPSHGSHCCCSAEGSALLSWCVWQDDEDEAEQGEGREQNISPGLSLTSLICLLFSQLLCKNLVFAFPHAQCFWEDQGMQRCGGSGGKNWLEKGIWLTYLPAGTYLWGYLP